MTNHKSNKPKTKALAKSAKKKLFPIVGIGASAGGLEALDQFLCNVPESSGIAYVVVQHLDPTQKGMLPELLQRFTKLKVAQVKDGMVIKPNCVYVIPPNKSMSVSKGILYLFDPVETRGLRLPVDFFFRSLADDRQELSIGLILSGMGSDGSTGLGAIKEKNGIVMVQEPSTAKFDSMPRSAIDSVMVDIIGPPDELPQKLMSFLEHIPAERPDSEPEVKDKSALEKILILLRNHTGNDFSLYKKSTMYRRVERRMAVHNIGKIASYVHFLSENPKEIDILFKELMIGVTNFFRDAAVWDMLRDVVIPEMLDNLQDGYSLRAWVPGCSTGEEAYSLAIVFKEALAKMNSQGSFTLQIFATDLDNDAIETARKGIFPANIATDVSSERLKHYFTETDDGYRINTDIREMVVFAQHNIIMHPPFTKIDILSCRNLLIYMDPELQIKILGMFYYSLNTEGSMLLGSSETLGGQRHLFEPVDAKMKIFKRSATALLPELFDFPSSFSRSSPRQDEKPIPVKSPPNIQNLAEQLLLEHFSPAGVLVNGKGDIIYISGRTGKYLEPAAGKANLNIFAMLREGLRNEFPIAFRKAIAKKETVVLENVKVGTNGSSQTVKVNIQWIHQPESLYGTIMVIFTDVPDIVEHRELPETNGEGEKSERERALEKELQNTRAEMQNTLEEMQTSQEELKSSNEELQSTNEELQSTNEELTTSKEEMQSLNEELQTVNAELLSKVEDYTRVENDMKNLLNSTDIATLFLDKELNIRRYTTEATKIFKLIKGDIGRPFTDQASELVYPDLADDALEVLNTLVFKQKQIPTKDDRWYSIRIMPYRTYDDKIDGLVITFINITDLKRKEDKLYETGQTERLLLSKSQDAIIKLSTDLKIQAFNPKAEGFFSEKESEVISKDFIRFFVAESHQRKTEKDMQTLLNKGRDGNLKMPVVMAEGNPIESQWNINILRNNRNEVVGVLMTENGGQKSKEGN